MIDIQAYYTKLVNGDSIKEDEMVELLKELAHFRKATAYLASCQAATLESLPAGASKSSRDRHVDICLTAADLANLNCARIRYPVELAIARERCLGAVKKQEERITIKASPKPR